MVRRAILVVLMVAPVGLIGWTVLRGRTPSLEPRRATSIISATSEFSQAGSLVNVSSLTRVKDSGGDRYYAEFTFSEHGSPAPIKAQGEFECWEGGWHFRWFNYQQGSTPKHIEIKSDMSPGEEFLKSPRPFPDRP
jgi:hypothetical protein